MPAHRFNSFGVESPLESVTPDAWSRFVAALEVQPLHAISRTGTLGAYGIRPSRLVELGYAIKLRRTGPNGARQECDFVAPWTQERFLKDLFAQHAVLVRSHRAYYDALRCGELKKPTEVSIAGALAILHVGGQGALENWTNLFDRTRTIYKRAQGAF
jgi:hypothetical protein